jgi:hypothetical protein
MVSILIDLHLTIIYVPMPLFPAPLFCTEGILKPLGIFAGNAAPYDVLMFLIGYCGGALFAAFIYRYAASTEKCVWFSRRKTWYIIICAHVFVALPCIVTKWCAYSPLEAITPYIQVVNV